jgi:glycosyltransferase involved in cell wall biosynthesis
MANAFSDLIGDLPVVYLDDRLPRWARISVRVPAFYFFSTFHLTYPWLLSRCVPAGEFDMLISHNTYTSLTSRALARKGRAPYIAFIWDPVAYILQKAYPSGPIRLLRGPLVRLGASVDRRLLADARAVIVAGEPARVAPAAGSIPVHVVAPGVHCAEEIPAGRGDYLLTATAWKSGKQLEELLRVVANLPDVKLVVAGRWLHDDYRRTIDALVDELRVADRVDILGEVDEQRLTGLYRGSRAVVVVNDERGFGLPIIEGAAQGAPCVAPEDCGAHRVFTHEKEGLFFPTGDWMAMSRHIAELMGDEQHALRLGANAWRMVRDRYSWDAHAQELIRVATSVLDGHAVGELVECR